LAGYTTGNTYIYIPIPTSIKEILATEYPAIIGNNISWDVTGDIIPRNNPNSLYSIASPGVISINSSGYEGTHLRVEFKDYSSIHVLGSCDCRLHIRFCS
jgi:hypothetical protein